jgi:hypothetical protein
MRDLVDHFPIRKGDMIIRKVPGEFTMWYALEDQGDPTTRCAILSINAGRGLTLRPEVRTHWKRNVPGGWIFLIHRRDE